MNATQLHSIFTDEQSAFQYAFKMDLLYNDGECEKCGDHYGVYSDKHKPFGCFLKCQKCGCKKSILHNSIFTRSKLPMNKVFHLLYCWAIQLSRDQTVHECKVTPDTVTNFFQSFRQACVGWLEDDGQKPIGGPGKTVEIDESLMSTRKNHAGRVLSQQWIFGGICRETKEKFVMQVPDRTSETLLPIIEEHILPETTISSDAWRAYNNVSELDSNYEHEVVNHSKNFVNPVTKAHTQNVERMWREVKRVKRRYEGINSKDINAHIAEYLWRDRNGVNMSNSFTKAVKLISETYYF